MAIMLKFVLRERPMGKIRNPSTRHNFVRIDQGILHMACRYCITAEVTHIDFT